MIKNGIVGFMGALSSDYNIDLISFAEMDETVGFSGHHLLRRGDGVHRLR